MQGTVPWFCSYRNTKCQFLAFLTIGCLLKVKPLQHRGQVMNEADPLIAGMSVAELNRRHEQARRRAAVLRSEAIDAFWHGVNAALWARLSSAQRAASRLSQRLQRRQHLHGSALPPAPVP